jgi:hypothetical protein
MRDVPIIVTAAARPIAIMPIARETSSFLVIVRAVEIPDRTLSLLFNSAQNNSIVSSYTVTND